MDFDAPNRTPSRRRPHPSSPDEESTLASLNGYLLRQGELDPSDKSNLRQFLDSHSGLLELDWSPIEDDLARQNETQLLEALLSKRKSKDEDISNIASSLHAKFGSTPSWTFLIGAGGSRPSPTEIPTVPELLPMLWKKAAEIDAPSLLRLESVCKRLDISDIEVLLTAIEIAQTATHSPGVVGLLEALLFQRSELESPASVRRIRRSQIGRANPENVEILSESSQTIFAVLVGMMTGKPHNAIHEAVVDRLMVGGQDAVITTNYDVCIEKAFIAQDHPYRYGFAGGGGNGSLVLKLHGSLNWYSCRSCDQHVAADMQQIDAAVQSGLYPIVAMCRSCSATAQQMIVPPTAMKMVQHPVLLDIRQQAEQAFSSAKMIVVIGYSFGESDQYIQRMIARAVKDDPEKSIVVFDASGGPVSRLRRFLSTHAAGFSVEDVHGVFGDAKQTAHTFVQRWLELHAVKALSTG